VTRYRFTDAPNREGFRMVPLTVHVTPKEASAAQEAARKTRERLANAYKEVEELEAKGEETACLIAARARLNHLRFLFEDRAPELTHAQKLAAYAAKLREMWRRK
jgi:hypothetical protein